MWGELGRERFLPEKVLWLVYTPHPHWIETQKDNLKMDMRETGFRQFVSISSRHLITDAMIMFGLEFVKEKHKVIENLNPIRLMIKNQPGSFSGISHHFLGAPFEIEADDVLREFLNSARRAMEEVGFAKDVVLISFNPFLEDLIISNLDRIRGLRYRFMSASP
jgi:hypothetical protein